MRMLRTMLVLAFIVVLTASVAPVQAESFRDLEQRVVEKILPNGLKVILLPRAGAPVASMVIYADVGSVDENQNATGLAHVFEHMAFKGSTSVGTTDYAKEKLALEKVDQAFLALRAERLRRPKPDEAKLKQLEEAFLAAQTEAGKFVVSNEFGEILERAGVQGLNAFTNFDQTVYLYSLPSNKLELWAAMEADRFTNPVLREFYKEKNVVMEERRMGESQPTQRMLEDFVAAAFKAHMYRSFVIGHMSDLQGLTRAQAQDWFNKYYRARNLTAVVVGDVDPQTTLPMIEKHLGKIPAGEKPGPVVTAEPPQRSEKRVTMWDPAQPILVLGYHRPSVDSPDFPAFRALSEILGGGRSSRLYRTLVKEQQVAIAAGAFEGFGEKYPGLFLFFAVPNKGKTNTECEAALDAEIAKLQDEGPTAEELAGVKARSKMRFIGEIESNMGMALALASAQNMKGDWRRLFDELDEIDRVTAADVQRVAKEALVRTNRTVGVLETTSEPAAR